ncbi:hypothetical protein MSSIH_1905 [Methanosarcina siciliae HI350]|uniref:Uncharacterized protein n=1 Tax=Methanosarcina siciliae HI350 TaxID=1434119 RepID=A0A0E3PDM4_9EURY|nr:hypothetical protein [Methanosarcina siciliae]AKB32595.1 hypothetical protein MSSIH_1905 [Methanosarcina siciliae HI350]
MTDTEKPKRSRGQHLKKNEVKVEILNSILKRELPVLESDIKEHLYETFGTRDVKTKNIHLQDLQKLQCIKKISNSGSDDKWEIDSLGHLNNIKKNFTQIELNQYKKAIEIVSVKFTNLRSILLDNDSFSCGALYPKTEDGLTILPVSINETDFKDYLEASPTFFDMCMSADVTILFNRWFRLSQVNGDEDTFIKCRREIEGIDSMAPYPKERFYIVTKDFYAKELPFIAFRQCISMDILKGKDPKPFAHKLINVSHAKMLFGLL